MTVVMVPPIVRSEPFGSHCTMILMPSPRLTDTSYAVMGLLDMFEPATPYQLKQIAQVRIFHFWIDPAHPALHGVRATRRGGPAR